MNVILKIIINILGYPKNFLNKDELKYYTSNNEYLPLNDYSIKGKLKLLKFYFKGGK